MTELGSTTLSEATQTQKLESAEGRVKKGEGIARHRRGWECEGLRGAGR